VRLKMLAAAAALIAVGSVGLLASAQVKVVDKLPDYTPVQGVSGSIKSVGSDTMNNLMTLWSEGFLKFYPNVRVEIEGKGSSTAPPALIAGTATFGPMSRQMKPSEIDSFEERYGYKPVQIPTSIDMLAVYVNKDNPIKGLTFPQIDGIFSSTRRLGLGQRCLRRTMARPRMGFRGWTVHRRGTSWHHEIAVRGGGLTPATKRPESRFSLRATCRVPFSRCHLQCPTAVLL
jgi:phosphate transport system substrate-binding protein